MKNFFLFSVLLSSIVFSGCQITEPHPPAKAPLEKNEVSQKLNIVTSFYPLAFFAKEIAGDMAEVTDLSGNQEVHDFTPSPKDIITLNNADLVIYQGAELESWTEDMIPQLQEKNIPLLEVSKNLKLHKEDDHEVEEHEEGYEDEEDEHHHGEFDPHTWLDPVLAQDMVDEIQKKIGEIDPQNLDIYQQNAENLKKKLQAFDAKFSNLSCTNEAIISHDAFGYLARRYNFIFHPIAGISPHDEPSAKLLAELKEEAKKGVTHILTEENNVKRFAETLARETGLKIFTVYTLETNSEPFFSAYEKNLNALKIALQCQ